MMKRSLAVILASLALASEARAQFDTPSFLPPRPGDDIGIYVSDLGDFALQGIWRQTGNLNLGLRVGYIDFDGLVQDNGAVVVGVDIWDRVFSAGNELPVDVSWTLGGGAAFNGGTLLEVPAGLSIGRVFDLDQFSLQVYAHPRLALFIEPDRPEPNDEVFLEGLFDFGVDAVLNENWKARLGVSLGGIDAVGFGVAYRWTRGAVVR